MTINEIEKRIIFGTGASSCKFFNDLYECSETAVDNGIRWFDTAPSYGTEETLGRVISQLIEQKKVEREDILVQTKIDPIQMYIGEIDNTVALSLKKMGLEYFDCVLIHWPIQQYFHQTWEALDRLKRKGLIINIGICNLRIEHLIELKSIGIIPDILQIERHPLNTFERERKFCIENGIILQDYSPLCKMHPRLREDLDLKSIAFNHSCGIGEIILRWHMQTDAIPVFTSTKPSRISTYSQLNTIQLTNNEIDIISSKNINFKLYLESLLCPGF